MKTLLAMFVLFLAGCQTTQDDAALVLSTGLQTASQTATQQVVKAVPIFLIGSILEFIVSLKECNGNNIDEMNTPHCKEICSKAGKSMPYCPAYISANYDQCDPESKTEQRWATRPAWWCQNESYYTSFKPVNYRR